MTGDGLAAAALADLIDRLAADDPAPGAGPAAAWACAMAAALVEMVTAVELRREPADPAAVRARGERAASLRARALALADLDVAAYTRVLDVLARRDEPGHGGRLREALADAAGRRWRSPGPPARRRGWPPRRRPWPAVACGARPWRRPCSVRQPSGPPSRSWRSTSPVTRRIRASPRPASSREPPHPISIARGRRRAGGRRRGWRPG